MVRLCFSLFSLGLLLTGVTGCNQSGDGTSGVKGTCQLLFIGGPQGKGIPPKSQGGVTVKVQTPSGERTLAETATDSAGGFQVPLRPGTYRLVAVALEGPSRHPPEPLSVEVRRGEFTRVELNFLVHIR